MGLKEIFQKFVLDLGFREDEYFEFDQTKCKNVLEIIEKKYDFGIKTAIDKYKDLDILVMNSSNDFVPFEFYENLLKKFNKDIPNGVIEGMSKGGFYCLINNNFNNVYIKNNCRSNIEKEILSGCFSFNKKLIEKCNNTIKFPKANEYKMYQIIKKNVKPMVLKLTDISLMVKISKCDFTSFNRFFLNINHPSLLKRHTKEFLLSCHPQIYNNDNEKLNNFINTLKEFGEF